jgi:hypothetical protein
LINLGKETARGQSSFCFLELQCCTTMWYNLQLIEGLSRQVLSFFYSPNNFFLLFIV